MSVADFTAFSIAAPVDSRLPAGGGYTVSGLYSITPDAITRAPNNLITSADNYGGQKQMYNGVLVNVSARPRNGLTVQGGVNLGKTVLDICAAREQQPEIGGVGGSGITPAVGLTNPHCLSDPGFVTRVTGLASYTIPKADVLVSSTFRSDQGASLAAAEFGPDAALLQDRRADRLLAACWSSRSRQSVAESAIGSRLRAPSSTALFEIFRSLAPSNDETHRNSRVRRLQYHAGRLDPGPVAGPDDESGSRGETE